MFTMRVAMLPANFWALEWRQREATTEDSKRGQSRNTVIRDPRILSTPPPPFKISGSAPGEVR